MDHYILDHTNERANSNNQAQTKSARLYGITTTNGVVVSAGAWERAECALTLNLFLPRFASSTSQHSVLNETSSTRRELQLRSRTISTLPLPFSFRQWYRSAQHRRHNVAFMLTNLSKPLSWNFRQDIVPRILKDAPQFQIDNPRKSPSHPNVKKSRTELPKS